MQEMITLRPHRFDQRQFDVGEIFFSDPKHVRFLTASGRAKPFDQAEPVAEAAQAAPEPTQPASNVVAIPARKSATRRKAKARGGTRRADK